MTTIIAEKIMTFPRIKDRIKVEVGLYSDYDSSLVWIAYRENGYGGWDKIPAMSRAEERTFPKCVGYAAHAFLKEIQAEKGL